MSLSLSRLVPPQTPELVEPLVITYLQAEFDKLNSKNKLTIEHLHGGKPWLADHRHWNYAAGIRATEVRFFSLILSQVLD
jgi:Cys-Gly metallodipeptidase DUG1